MVEAEFFDAFSLIVWKSVGEWFNLIAWPGYLDGNLINLLPPKKLIFGCMDDIFEIPVTYKGEELSFPASLVNKGSTYAIRVTINGQDINFEPDEEKKFRALVSMEELNAGVAFDKGLLEVIAGTLEEVLK